MYVLAQGLLVEFSDFDRDEKAQNLRTIIQDKYERLRRKALKLLSRGDPKNPRPKTESKAFFEEIQKEVIKAGREKKTLAKLMKKQGFLYTEKPQVAFGPDLAKFYDYCNERNAVMGLIEEKNMEPESELTEQDLFYCLIDYEEVETAIGYLKHDDYEREFMWQKSEAEKVDRIEEFVESLLISQLSVRTHFSVGGTGSRINKDRERYIKVRVRNYWYIA